MLCRETSLRPRPSHSSNWSRKVGAVLPSAIPVRRHGVGMPGRQCESTISAGLLNSVVLSDSNSLFGRRDIGTQCCLVVHHCLLKPDRRHFHLEFLAKERYRWWILNHDDVPFRACLKQNVCGWCSCLEKQSIQVSGKISSPCRNTRKDLRYLKMLARGITVSCIFTLCKMCEMQ